MARTASEIVVEARRLAGLSQRELARRAGTAQSVVARIELGLTSPNWDTLIKLVGAAGGDLDLRLDHAPGELAGLLEAADGVLALEPEDRLRELRNVDRFISGARRS